MMKRLILIALVAAATPSAAIGQDRQADESIIVTGQRLSPSKEAQRFVRQVATRVDGQLSRFDDPVCARAVGLSAEFNGLVEGRLEQIAVEAGVELAKDEGCTPNLLVMIAHDADALVPALRERFPLLFEGVRASDMKRALADGPVHMWSIVEVRNEDGERISGADEDGVKILQVRSASRAVMPTQQVVVQSVLVIDADATVGKSLTQVADYAGMRTLAGARPPGEKGRAETILSLFDEAETAPPPMMTGLDESFLRGLYQTRLNGRATSELYAISKTIVKDAKTGE